MAILLTSRDMLGMPDSVSLEPGDDRGQRIVRAGESRGVDVTPRPESERPDHRAGLPDPPERIVVGGQVRGMTGASGIPLDRELDRDPADEFEVADLVDRREPFPDRGRVPYRVDPDVDETTVGAGLDESGDDLARRCAHREPVV